VDMKGAWPPLARSQAGGARAHACHRL